MARGRFDDRELRRKLKAAAQATPSARRAALGIASSEVLRRIIFTAPRDTNRYVRGWIQAGNTAGVIQYHLPSLKEGGLQKVFEKKAQREFGYWQGIVRWNQRVGRTDKHARYATRKYERWKTIIESMTGSDIGFNVFGGKREFSLRTKVYGGVGRIVTTGDRTYLELHNREAHATLVEWRHGVVRKAERVFRGVGIHRAGMKYIEQVRKQAGFAAGNSAA